LNFVQQLLRQKSKSAGSGSPMSLKFNLGNSFFNGGAQILHQLSIISRKDCQHVEHVIGNASSHSFVDPTNDVITFECSVQVVGVASAG
jgi:hypothetical protein